MKQILKGTLFVLTSLLLLPLTASADAVEIDGIWYNLVGKAKSAEVTRDPSKTIYEACYSGDIVIPSKVTYESIEYDVTVIGNSAFENSTELTSVTIPNSVTRLANYAFESCSGLEYVNIPNSITSIGESAFYGCSSLTSITIPNSVITIGNTAFQGCTGLTSFIIPNNVTTIGWGLFWECSGLTSITLNNNITIIPLDMFAGCTSLKSFTIPDGVTSIGGAAFAACSSLSSITIPNSVTEILSTSFYNCNALTSVTLSNNLTQIGEFAFGYCTNMTSINIPNSVTTIGNIAFEGCSKLTTVMIGSGIQEIKSNSFLNCGELTDVYCFAEDIPTTDDDAFENSYVNYATLHVPTSAISAYSASAPWSGFGTITAITSEDITIGDLGIGTFCGSNPIDFTGIEDIKAYVVSSYEKASGQVTLTRTYYVPPFTGVVVKGNKGVYTIPAGVGQPVYPNMMKGVTTNTALNKVSGDYTNYVLANKGGNLGFYAITNGTTLAAGKAYLPLPTADLPSAAREFTLIFDDGETTEIMKVASQEKASQGYYDLQGRRVANPTSGLYIVNGKKVIIK